MNEGWIKLHRKVLDNPFVMKDAEYLAVWIYLLLSATHQEMYAIFKGEKTLINQGSFVTGRQKISQTLGISESKVERILNCFESEQQIEQQKSSKNRVITILNWDSYQGSEQQIEQQMDNKWTTSEQQVNTNKNNKNDKNINNKKKTNKRKSDYYSNAPLNDAFTEYVKFRKEIKKPMTDRAIELAIKKLDELSGKDDNTAIKILEQSIREGWTGLYELKKTTAKEPKFAQRSNSLDSDVMDNFYAIMGEGNETN